MHGHDRVCDQMIRRQDIICIYIYICIHIMQWCDVGNRIVASTTKVQQLSNSSQPLVQFLWHTLLNVSLPRAMHPIGCLNLLGFCSPIVSPSSWSRQIVKGWKSGVASKSKQEQLYSIHPWNFIWNILRLLRLTHEVSTRQKLTLLWAVQ